MEQIVVLLFLSCFLAEFLLEFALNELNLRHVRRPFESQRVSEGFGERLGPQQLRKAVGYTLAKGRLERWASIYGGVVILSVLFGGALPLLERFAERLGGFFPPGLQAAGILFCFGVGLVVSILMLPTDLCATFVIEERFGFNRTTLRLFLTDRLKAFALSVVIGMPFLFGVLTLMSRAGAAWWLWAFAFIFGFQLLMAVVYPVIIAPLFNKFEPLPDGELRQRIMALAERVGFKAGGIFTMDGSRRSKHSNAYFTGLGKAKRIVLFDTLVRQLTIEQALAVLAHEMGHYKLKHIRRALFLRGFLLLVGLFVLSELADFEPLYRAFGLARPSHHGALVLFGFLAGPATFYLRPLMNFLSRRHEYEADRFAVKTLKGGKAMAEALVELAVENLANPAPHPWYSAYHYSHPTPAERVRAIREEAGFRLRSNEP